MMSKKEYLDLVLADLVCQLSNLFQLFIDYVIVIDFKNEINMEVFPKIVPTFIL